jgi:hypothetical protein
MIAVCTTMDELRDAIADIANKSMCRGWSLTAAPA